MDQNKFTYLEQLCQKKNEFNSAEILLHSIAYCLIFYLSLQIDYIKSDINAIIYNFKRIKMLFRSMYMSR